ncbi:MAG: isoprenylcysteine carboxylmethyltransferase family protein [Microbacteriaceae bacterium]|nr:isoprenylcysteine carboxylmethyltransferase family protein [Nocardioidaceae bacterium]MCL2796413.1 isoprenylcysteine carboxylmethyltransferase family protein [Microbacteriaceae bacterium]
MAVPYVAHSHVAEIVLSISIVAFAVGELLQTARLRRGVPTSDVLGELLFRLVFFAGIVALPLSYAHLPGAVVPGGRGLFVVGVVAGWLGLLLRWWCFLVLGRYFTTVIKADDRQTVVDRGPYRVLRHPSYSGLLLAFVGCGLMLANWCGLLVSSTVVLAALVYRIRIEEKALTAALGDAYREFASTRSRLVPFLW